MQTRTSSLSASAQGIGLRKTWYGMLQVANSGLVPVLVAMVEQIPSRRKSDVQNQAASLLLEAAASDVGMVCHLLI